jgi:ATP-dependent Clp protease adaptor protein ClpS
MSTKTEEHIEIELDELLLDEHQIVLYNDDVNTFDYVIELLVKYCKHEVLQAEQCAFLVHYTGKCIVKKGSFKELKIIHQALSEKGLTVDVD